MIIGIVLAIIAAGAITAGVGHVRKAHAMRHFDSTAGDVLTRDIKATGPDMREGVWGKGGGWTPAVTYSYSVDGVGYTGDRMSYAQRGYRRSAAEKQVAAVPARVQVWYDPDDPSDAYLAKHTPGPGWALTLGGALGALIGVALIVASFF